MSHEPTMKLETFETNAALVQIGDVLGSLPPVWLVERSGDLVTIHCGNLPANTVHALTTVRVTRSVPGLSETGPWKVCRACDGNGMAPIRWGAGGPAVAWTSCPVCHAGLVAADYDPDRWPAQSRRK